MKGKWVMNKGLMNLHSLVYDDPSNIANLSNSKVFASILNGKTESDAFNYLMNLSSIRINDIRSLNFYNESGLANTINANRHLEEILESKNIRKLPKPKQLRGSLLSALKSRRSTRNFSEYVMSIQELSTLLKYSVGISDRYSYDTDGNKSYHRYHGSGGGFYPITVYVLINQVDGLENGIYAYLPYSHCLSFVSDKLKLSQLYKDVPVDDQNMNVCLLFKYELNRNYLKYGELALMLAFIETGMMAHNVHLVSQNVGYRTCDVAGFNKKYVESILDLDSINSHIIYSLIIGKEI